MRRLLPAILAVILPFASLFLYVGLSSAQVGEPSFPLDDAWIHLTFARNLATRGELSFVSGQPSAGSTSPLWTFALVPGFWFGGAPERWVHFLGVALLAGTALLGSQVAARTFPDVAWLPSVTALTFSLEWHFAWSAFSGMETMFFVFLLLLLMYAQQRDLPPLVVGLLGGLVVVTRPEGGLLVGAIALQRAVRRRTDRAALAADSIALAVGMLAPIAPYLAFNWLNGGSLLPNTFHAKQAEYESLLAAPLWERLWDVGGAPFVGAQALLLPGFAAGVWLAIRQRRGDALLFIAWWLALTLSYTVRLPVTYQHGRYLVPGLPSMLIIGLWGSWRVSLEFGRLSALLARVVSRTWQIAFAILLLVFWLRGAVAYAADAAAIDCIGVQTAHWLREHTAPQDRLAVHDIGAVGYLLPDRPLVDLAGLISPDVIGFIRDEPRLLAYIIERDAAYLVTSDAWHPAILRDPRIVRVYQNNCANALAAGGYEIGVFSISR